MVKKRLESIIKKENNKIGRRIYLLEVVVSILCVIILGISVSAQNQNSSLNATAVNLTSSQNITNLLSNVSQTSTNLTQKQPTVEEQLAKMDLELDIISGKLEKGDVPQVVENKKSIDEVNKKMNDLNGRMEEIEGTAESVEALSARLNGFIWRSRITTVLLLFIIGGLIYYVVDLKKSTHHHMKHVWSHLTEVVNFHNQLKGQQGQQGQQQQNQQNYQSDQQKNMFR